MTPIQLTDLKIVQLCEHGMDCLHSTSACARHEGVHKERPDCYCDEARYLDPDEVLTVLTDEALIGELERRGAFEPRHIYEVGTSAIGVQHPIRCRQNGRLLLDCEEGNAAIALPGPPAPPGYRYTATFTDGEFSDWEPVGSVEGEG